VSNPIELTAERVIDVSDGDSAAPGINLANQYTGPDTLGVGLTVVTATWTGPGSPKNDDMRRAHGQRLGKKAFPLVLAVIHDGQTWLTGPGRDTAPVGPIEASQAQRILQAGLDEPDGLSGRQRVSYLLRSLDTSGIPGLSNVGLFANHFLTTSAPELPEWKDATESAMPLLELRGDQLLTGMGYRLKRATSSAHILSSEHNAEALSIAVVLKDEEAFEQASSRFAVSPVAYGLHLATEHGAPWLIALRGSQIRIYPATPGVGVGSRGQADTYFELDLVLLDAKCAGYLGLVFTADALQPNGFINLLLEGSERYATSLGERLRDRVYAHAVPKLAMAVAGDLGRLGNGDLDTAYEVTLRILFRLLFQAYAEDGELLPYGKNDRYTRNSLKKWAQDFVDDPGLVDRLDDESTAIWRDLLQVWEVIDTGNSTWEVPPYNGGLFGSDPDLHPHGALISRLKLTDATVGDAVFHLVVDEMGEGGLGAVDFRSLSVREFGTIYEGLLESELSLTDIDLTLDRKNTFVPAKDGDEVEVHAGDVYFHNKSGERKATGSYFTPAFAVQHLIDRALVPTLDRHLEEVAELLDVGDESGAYRKFFDFRVGDLAMGSGHFLVAAIDQIEVQMAAFLVDHPVPGVTNELRRLEKAARDALGDDAGDYDIEPQSLLRRQIARRCVYGIDINPIAVELARVGIWIHTFVPGLPMSSLDHNLVCANSLTGIGTIDEALEALEPGTDRTGTVSSLRIMIETALDDAKELLLRAAESAEATKAEVKEAAAIAREAAEKAERAKALFDAAVAARIGEVDLTDVHDVDTILTVTGTGEIGDSIDSLNPGHMPYLFPEVFLRDRGGFDVLIGNPPWEKIKVEEHGWWGLRFPGLRGLSQAKKNALLKELKVERPDLVASYKAEVEVTDRMRAVIARGPFKGIGRGDIDLYQAFAWRNWQLVRDGGSAGVVLPRGALSGAGTVEWRRTVLDEGAFTDVCFLTNSRAWVFEGVHMSYTLALATITKKFSEGVAFCGPFYSYREYLAGRNDRTTATFAEFSGWSMTLAFPAITDGVSGEILREMKKAPPFDSASGFEFKPQTELHATSDRSLFSVDLSDSDGKIPVLTGASFNLWSPNFGDPYGYADADVLLSHLLQKTKRGATSARSAFSGMAIEGVDDLPINRARIVFRDIARATDYRTAIFCLASPGVSMVHQSPYLLRRAGTEGDEAYLLAIVSSIPFDWYARRWVEIHLTYQLLGPMPVPRPPLDSPLRKRVVELSGRLAAVDSRYDEWADAVGVPVGSLNEEPERSDAIYELDALVSLLYGLSWDQVVHIFETFHRGWGYSERLAAVKNHHDYWKGRG